MRYPTPSLRGAVPWIAGLLAACGASSEPAANALAPSAFEPPAAVMPSPIAGQAHIAPLRVYVGHDPGDPVDGVAFFDRTEVATALNAAVGDADLRHRIVRDVGHARPIFAIDARVASWGCGIQGCDRDSWTFIVDPVTGKGEVCHHVAAALGQASRWYAGDRPVLRLGPCPTP